jgi:hypothetical protein
MTDKTLRAIGELIGSVPSAGSFAARRAGSAENLVIEVAGVGRSGVMKETPPILVQARRDHSPASSVERPGKHSRRRPSMPGDLSAKG